MAVARVAIRYALPVLSMTSRFCIMSHTARDGTAEAALQCCTRSDKHAAWNVFVVASCFLIRGVIYSRFLGNFRSRDGVDITLWFVTLVFSP